MSPGFWAADVDRHPDRHALQILAVGTAVPMERLAAMGFSAYEGSLWASYHPKGALAWVMPIGRYGRRRRDHGQQFCRQCLMEDEQPFFRRRWRLAFNIVCERHAIMLDDACRQCGAPVEFHTGDFGKRLLEYDCPIVRCGSCGSDYRLVAADNDRPAPEELMAFQYELNKMLGDGWSPNLPGGGIYSFLAFEGLHCIVRILESRDRGERLRNLMQAQDGDLPLDVSARRPQPRFEELRLCDRSNILQWCTKFMPRWPDKFIYLCQKARVSSSYILHDKAAAPYWFASAIGEYLYDRDYQPSQAEWATARAWLVKAGLPVSANSVRRLLGLSHIEKRHLPDSVGKAKRWNPR